LRHPHRGSENEDAGDAYNGAVTDALGKIASYLAIGIDVYKGGGPTKSNPQGVLCRRVRFRLNRSTRAATRQACRPLPITGSASCEASPRGLGNSKAVFEHSYASIL